MAATRLIPMHVNKGKTIAQSLGDRTDYAKNPEKTDKGELVTGYQCDPMTVDEEFMLSKRQYEQITGRRQRHEVIAYQIRQSFKPGEITPEEANRLGQELALRFTKGKYAFIVATHTDRAHVHNHIVFNSTSIDGTRKFKNFWLSSIALQRVSDLVCLENGLSVITPKPYRERAKRTDYPRRVKNRDVLCEDIDTVLQKKPESFEAFLQELRALDYEIKCGKHISVKGKNQARFIRLSSLEEGYFEVKMLGVTSNNGLMDEDLVRDYLIQHSPLPFEKTFKWRSPIQEKVRIAGYTIPTYCICLNGEELYKPYSDSFVSDRVKKISDSIQDIQVKKFYRGEILSAVLWYAHTAFYGTINDNTVKGIRVRQGNILIGDRSTCNSYFKEERFNGWIIGELHVLDPDLIVNSRRDDFEKNEAYYALIEMFKEWAFSVSKDIRRISYERSLSREKKAVVEAQSFEDVNDLCYEDYGYAEDTTESDFLDSGESEVVAEMDYLDKLSSLIDQKKLRQDTAR